MPLDKEIYLSIWGRPLGVIAKVQDSGLVVSEFEFQSRYYIHFRIKTLGKDMNPLIYPVIG